MGKRNHEGLKKGASHDSSVTTSTMLSSHYSGPSLEEYAEAEVIVPRLAARCYHLPGNNWCQDWVQYMMNNHPLLGLCCHHKLHPLKLGSRIVILIGSIAFGLIITNCVHLYYAYNKKDLNDVAFSIHLENNTTIVGTKEADLTITHGMIWLWTVGSILHSIFDLSVWRISACACCLPGGMFQSCDRFQRIGSNFVLVLVGFLVAVACFIVVLRAIVVSRQETLTEVAESQNIDPSKIKWGHVNSLNSFSFLVSYGVELALALLFYFPTIGTVLFSGILGCASLPILGGRPVEVRKQQSRKLRDMERERDEYHNEYP